MPAARTSADANKAMALSTSTLVQVADMALRAGTTRDWKREFILHLELPGLVLFEGAFVGVFATPCRGTALQGRGSTSQAALDARS